MSEQSMVWSPKESKWVPADSEAGTAYAAELTRIMFMIKEYGQTYRGARRRAEEAANEAASIFEELLRHVEEGEQYRLGIREMAAEAGLHPDMIYRKLRKPAEEDKSNE